MLLAFNTLVENAKFYSFVQFVSFRTALIVYDEKV